MKRKIIRKNNLVQRLENKKMLEKAKLNEIDAFQLREIDVALKLRWGGLIDFCVNGKEGLIFFSRTTKGVYREIRRLCKVFGYTGNVKVVYV